MDYTFDASVIEWRGPAPFVFAVIPDALTGDLRHDARTASYGWGVIPVVAKLGQVAFTTSLFPRNGAYLLPLKLAVQRATGVLPGDTVGITMRVGKS